LPSDPDVHTGNLQLATLIARRDLFYQRSLGGDLGTHDFQLAIDVASTVRNVSLLKNTDDKKRNCRDGDHRGWRKRAHRASDKRRALGVHRAFIESTLRFAPLPWVAKVR
jgi:hypothetical protein